MCRLVLQGKQTAGKKQDADCRLLLLKVVGYDRRWRLLDDRKMAPAAALWGPGQLGVIGRLAHRPREETSVGLGLYA